MWQGKLLYAATMTNLETDAKAVVLGPATLQAHALPEHQLRYIGCCSKQALFRSLLSSQACGRLHLHEHLPVSGATQIPRIRLSGSFRCFKWRLQWLTHICKIGARPRHCQALRVQLTLKTVYPVFSLRYVIVRTMPSMIPGSNVSASTGARGTAAFAGGSGGAKGAASGACVGGSSRCTEGVRARCCGHCPGAGSLYA